MRRIVKLTERDLTRIVRRVIREQEIGTAEQPDGPQVGTAEQPETPEIGTALSLYIVKPGDTLTKIAKEMGVTVSDILRDNPNIKNRNIIKPGQEIEINRK